MERTTPVENLDLPKPWEDRQITRAQWEKHEEYLMSFDAGCGCRPDGWWLFEKNMEPPSPKHTQTLVPYQMGELRGSELERCLGWWRSYYDDAHKMEDRTSYWRWEDIPPALIKQWDRERAA